MAKTTVTYWNPLHSNNKGEWRPIKRLEAIAEELTLSIEGETGEYTRLTRFHPGADTTPFGGKSHEYPAQKSLFSAAISMIRPLICGWKPVIMQVVLLVKYMDRSRLIPAVWFLRYRFPTKVRLPVYPK